MKFLKVKVRPGAGKSEIKEEMSDGTLKINIAAVPEKGKANKELISFLAKEFKVPKKNIEIISGETSQIKHIKIFYEK